MHRQGPAQPTTNQSAQPPQRQIGFIPPRSDRREEYQQKLKHPRWQKMRLEVLSRDNWTCQRCYDTETSLNVHHRYYEADKDPLGLSARSAGDAVEKQSRPTHERDLIHAMQVHFLSEEVDRLADAFRGMDLTHRPEVVACMIAWVISKPDLQRELVNRYREYLFGKTARS